jgi:hypothetical protein
MAGSKTSGHLARREAVGHDPHPGQPEARPLPRSMSGTISDAGPADEKGLPSARDSQRRGTPARCSAGCLAPDVLGNATWRERGQFAGDCRLSVRKPPDADRHPHGSCETRTGRVKRPKRGRPFGPFSRDGSTGTPAAVAVGSRDRRDTGPRASRRRPRVHRTDRSRATRDISARTSHQVSWCPPSGSRGYASALIAPVRLCARRSSARLAQDESFSLGFSWRTIEEPWSRRRRPSGLGAQLRGGR